MGGWVEVVEVVRVVVGGGCGRCVVVGEAVGWKVRLTSSTARTKGWGGKDEPG